MGTAENRTEAAGYDACSARSGPVVCMQACPVAPEKLRPDVGKMVRATSFLREPLSLVLPGSGLWLADVWPWLFPSQGSAKWNLLWPFLFQPIFSLVYPALSRVRPARLFLAQAAVFQQPNLQTPPARASQQQ